MPHTSRVSRPRRGMAAALAAVLIALVLAPLSSTAAHAVPGPPPSDLEAFAGDGEVVLTWTSPGGDVVDYVIEYFPAALGSTWYTYNDGVSTSTTAIITGYATEGVGTYRVLAMNSAGELSYPSASVTIDGSAGTPSSPTHLALTPHERSIDVSWDAPNDAGASAITDYVIQYRSSDKVSWLTVNDGVSTATSVTIAGLTPTWDYTVRVYAVNSEGNSIPLYVTGKTTASTSPEAPSGLTALAGDTTVELGWDAPSAGSPGPATYRILWARMGSDTWTLHGDTTALTYTATGLSTGTDYQFKVYSIVSGHGSALSLISGVKTNTVDFPPDAPTISMAFAPASTLGAVAWSDGASEGTSAITGYRVLLASDGGPFTEVATTDASMSSAAFAGLTPSTTYDVRVIAFSAVGDSAPSATSSFTTPDAGTGPAAPQHLTAVADDGQVALSWSPVTGADNYVVFFRAPGGLWASVGTSDTTTTVTELTNGVTYEFQVIAASGSTGGDPSSISATPRVIGPASAPRSVTAIGFDTYVTLEWAAPEDDGGRALTGYTVRHRLAGSGTWTSTTVSEPSATDTIITGLTNGSAYEFEIAAITSVGEGAAASATATPLAPPSQPTSLAAVAGDAEVVLTWEAPDDDGGAAVEGYVITYRAGASIWVTLPGGPLPGTARTATVSGLLNGNEYEFAVSAANARGSGAQAFVFATPRTAPVAPDAPNLLRGESHDASVTLTWAAPSDDGGSPITDYMIQYRVEGGPWVPFADGTSTATTATVTGLTNGTEYEFAVAAVSAAGQGPWRYERETPLGLAAAPVVKATTESGSVTLTWAPVDGNGSRVVAYFVEVYDDRYGWIGATAFDAPVSGEVSHTFTGLTNGETVMYRVSAITEGPSGLLSEPVSVIVGARPQQDPGELAFTGAPGSTTPTIAVGLLMAGGLAVAWGARRRRARGDAGATH